jgi:hypothetical protein
LIYGEQSTEVYGNFPGSPSKMLNMELFPLNAGHDFSYKFIVGSTLANVGKKYATRVYNREPLAIFF